ncbi:Reticulon-4 receptor-like 2 [Holothuria leucospilota]|uniref:Reticulon-4 receptor-like 2 n=1 Tax=Holothuria leucospilota TaxID=206669 RepID=A0A9Q1BBC8_HOLLE|nr:Reticulon-4 receptor-like 2 [Holothuria leucospilota]
MLLPLLVFLSAYTPAIPWSQPPSCGEVCYYDGQFQIADCSGIDLQVVPTKDGCEPARLLDLSHNGIASLHENDMIGSRGAQHLDFSFNRIYNIEPRSFSGSNSVTHLNLYLSSNQIAVLRNETFSKCEESLQQLHLDRNNIEVIEKGALIGLAKLAHLFLGHNNLQSLEATIFHDLISLESLYISFNRLVFLPGDLFSTLNRLKHLDLSNNNLLLLGDELFNQRCQLMTVVLANNRLLNIPNQLKNPCLSRLQALDIRNNNISDASNITQYLNATDKLFIGGNPFHCDCNLESLRQWAQQEVMSSELKCIVPSNGESRQIRTLPALCSTESPATTEISSPMGEQKDVSVQQAAPREDKNIPTLQSSSRTISQTTEGPDHTTGKPVIVLAIVLGISLVTFVITLYLVVKCLKRMKSAEGKGTPAQKVVGRESKNTNHTQSNKPSYEVERECVKLTNGKSSQKPGNNTYVPSSQEFKIDMTTENCPSAIPTKENLHNGKTIGDGNISSQDGDIEERQPLIRKVEHEKWETPSVEEANGCEQNNDLGMMGKFPNNSGQSMPKTSRSDTAGRRKKASQSSYKMKPKDNSYKIYVIKNDQNASNIGGDCVYVRSSQENQADRKHTHTRRLDKQYGKSESYEIRQGHKESEDLGIVGKLTGNSHDDVIKSHECEKENCRPNSLYHNDSKSNRQNQEEGMEIRQRVTPQKNGPTKHGVLKESDKQNFA